MPALPQKRFASAGVFEIALPKQSLSYPALSLSAPAAPGRFIFLVFTQFAASDRDELVRMD